MPSGAANASGSRLKCSFSMFRKRILASMTVFCAAGAAAGNVARAPALFWLAAGLCFLIACLLSKRLVALFGAALFLSAAVISWKTALPEPFAREKAAVTGVVCAEPRRYEDSLCLVLNRVTVDGEPYPYRLRLYLYVHGGKEPPSCLYGDEVRAEGVNIRVPKESSGPSDYDQRRTLWRSGIGATASCGAANASVREGGPSPLRWIARLRAALVARLDVLLGPDATLARALLLGDKTSLSEEEYDAFRDAGIVHLLAVSGLHVTILALNLRRFLQRALRFSFKASFFGVLPALLLYAAVTGFPSSILRAALVFALIESAPLTGDVADPITCLAEAYLLISVFSPLRQFEPGFLLSFGAMLGLFVLMPVLEKGLPMQGKLPRRGVRRVLRRGARGVVRAAEAGLCVVLGTLPAASWTVGGVSVWSLATNIVALPLATLALPLLVAALLLSWLWLPAGMAAAWIAALPIKALSALAGLIAGLGAPLRFALPRMAPGFCALYFLVFALISPFLPPRNHERAYRLRVLGMALLVGVAAASSLWATAPVRGETGLRATFLDVGQGDSVLINAQGRLHMVDTGRGSSAALRLAASAAKLDSLFCTHTDLDHAGGLAAVLRSGCPDAVYLPAGWEGMTIAPETAAALAGRAARPLARGDVVPLSEEVSCEVLYPAREGAPSGDNDGSLALLVRYGEGSLLLLGDLPDTALDGPLPDSSALLLAHHGSATSSGEWALETAAPSAVFLSVGANSSGLPSGNVLERVARLGIPLFRTDVCGDISARVSPDGSLLVTTHRPMAEEGL